VLGPFGGAFLIPRPLAVVAYLGMAYLKAGNKEAAKATLTKALKLGDTFTEVEEAKRALAELQ